MKNAQNWLDSAHVRHNKSLDKHVMNVLMDSLDSQIAQVNAFQVEDQRIESKTLIQI